MMETISAKIRAEYLDTEQKLSSHTARDTARAETESKSGKKEAPGDVMPTQTEREVLPDTEMRM